MEEVSSSTQQTAGNAVQTSSLANSASEAVQNGERAMNSIEERYQAEKGRAPTSQEAAGKLGLSVGKYIRMKDREQKDGQFRQAAGGGGDGSDWRRVKVHVGKHAGLDLGDLDQGAVEALVTRWLPDAMANPKPLKADRELIAGLRGAADVLGIVLEDDGNEPF